MCLVRKFDEQSVSNKRPLLIWHIFFSILHTLDSLVVYVVSKSSILIVVIVIRDVEFALLISHFLSDVLYIDDLLGFF